MSGNPDGRPKKFLTLLSDALRKKLGEIDPETGKTYAEAISDGVVEIICNCVKMGIPPPPQVVVMFREVADRTEGRPEQRVALTSEDGFDDPEQLVRDLLAIAAERIGESFKS